MKPSTLLGALSVMGATVITAAAPAPLAIEVVLDHGVRGIEEDPMCT